MSTLAFTSEIARLQQAIAEWHDLVFGAVSPRGAESADQRARAGGGLRRRPLPVSGGPVCRPDGSCLRDRHQSRPGSRQHKLGAPSRVGLNARIADCSAAISRCARRWRDCAASGCSPRMVGADKFDTYSGPSTQHAHGHRCQERPSGPASPATRGLVCHPTHPHEMS
jgi:hypothetical protein